MKKHKPKAYATMRRELNSIEKTLDRDDLPKDVHDELYGARQAMSWILGPNAMSPWRAALLGMKECPLTEGRG